MGNFVVLRALERKYQLLLSEWETAHINIGNPIGLDAILEAADRSEVRKQEIDDVLAALETVIWLFEPEWDPSTIIPKGQFKRKQPNREISRNVYAFVREASKARTPIGTRDLSKKLAVRLGIENPDNRDLSRLDSAIYNVLQPKVGQYVFIHPGKPRRWATFPPDPSDAASSPSTPERPGEWLPAGRPKRTERHY